MIAGTKITNCLIGLVVLMATAFAAMPAHSHGSLTMEDDRCKLRIGKYLMHFAGYQPHDANSLKRYSEFCEDIPVRGTIHVVLDLIDPELRAMPISVQVLEDRGRDKDNIAPVIFEMPAQSYPTGSLSYRYNFDKPGKFVGLITAGSGADRMVARFPFSVGKTVSWWTYAGYVILILAVIGGVIFWALRSHHRVLDQMHGQR